MTQTEMIYNELKELPEEQLDAICAAVSVIIMERVIMNQALVSMPEDATIQ